MKCIEFSYMFLNLRQNNYTGGRMNYKHQYLTWKSHGEHLYLDKELFLREFQSNSNSFFGCHMQLYVYLCIQIVHSLKQYIQVELKGLVNQLIDRKWMATTWLFVFIFHIHMFTVFQFLFVFIYFLIILIIAIANIIVVCFFVYLLIYLICYLLIYLLF